MEIKKISKEIHENARSKGFYEKERNIGEFLMLIVSEVAEAMEADRKENRFNNIHWPDRCSIMDIIDGKVYADTGTIEEIRNNTFETHVKNTFEDEIADSVIRLFDLAEYLSIDLEWHIRAKMNYNKTRPYKHGKKY